MATSKKPLKANINPKAEMFEQSQRGGIFVFDDPSSRRPAQVNNIISNRN